MLRTPSASLSASMSASSSTSMHPRPQLRDERFQKLRLDGLRDDVVLLCAPSAELAKSDGDRFLVVRRDDLHRDADVGRVRSKLLEELREALASLVWRSLRQCFS